MRAIRCAVAVREGGRQVDHMDLPLSRLEAFVASWSGRPDAVITVSDVREGFVLPPEDYDRDLQQPAGRVVLGPLPGACGECGREGVELRDGVCADCVRNQQQKSARD